MNDIEKIQSSLKSDKRKPVYIILLYLTQFFLKWEIFQAKAAEKMQIHILY
jgi:hypothetical protein